MSKYLTEEQIKKELTPEQYERYLILKEECGIEVALQHLPRLSDTTVTQYSGVVNKTIKQLRQQHNLTQTDLANILNVSQREYWRYEQDGYSVNFHTLAKIALFYNISLDCFTGYISELKPMFPNESTSVNGYILSEMKEAKTKKEKYTPHN